MTNCVASACFCLYLCVACFVQPSALLAQQEDRGSPGSDPENTEPARSDAKGPILPAPLGGFRPLLTSEPERTLRDESFLLGSITANVLYMDNAFAQNNKTVSDYQYSIMPRVGFQKLGKQTQWLLDYAGGLTYDQRIPGNSQQTHSGAVDMQHHFTRRLAAELRQDYTMTNNPFPQIGTTQLLPTPAGPGQLSPLVVPSPITRFTSVSNANLTYRLSEHSGMGTSGSFSAQRFRDAATSTGAQGALIDTTITAGRAFYVRQVSANQTIGVEYQLQDLRFDGGLARTLDHTMFLFDGISFRKNMTLALYAGPDLTHTRNAVILNSDLSSRVVPVLADRWSVGGGLEYTWQGRRTGFRLSGDRRVTDGGGFLGAVYLNTAALQLQQALSLRWSTSVELLYSDGRAIAVPASFGDNRVTTEEGLIGFVYMLTRHMSLTAQYGRIRQPHAGPLVLAAQPGHNQVLAGFTYEFEKVLSK